MRLRPPVWQRPSFIKASNPSLTDSNAPHGLRVCPRFKAVGSHCLEWFLPSNNPSSVQAATNSTMTFLNDFLGNSKNQITSRPPQEALAHPNHAMLENHLARRRYGRFTLTNAIRPGYQLDVVPQAGYRLDTYVDSRTHRKLPAIIASASSEVLFEVFLALLEPLGNTCDVILESSHRDHANLVHSGTREGIERLILESMLWDFEDLILDDGCTGVAVMHPSRPMEVQLDEHKLLIIYATDRTPFEEILQSYGVDHDERIRFISQGEHLHTSHSRFAKRFDDMQHRLGVHEDFDDDSVSID